MKKTLLAIAAMVAMVACTNDDVISVNQEAIGFDNAFIENSTRSVNDPSYTNNNLFDDFAVYGFVEGATLFDGTTVEGSALNDTWTYDGTQYWIAGATYNFAAVAPQTDANWTKTEATAAGTTLSFTNTGEQDVLYAQTAAIEGKTEGNAKVAFTFRHILSKVKLSFENAYNASAATLKVYDVKITNAYETAKAELSSSSTNWENQGGTLVLNFGAATDDEATDAKENAEVAYGFGETYETQNELLLIPGMIHGGYNVTFKVDLLVSGTPIKTYEHTATVNFTPAAGSSYDIKAVVNAENIDPEKEQEPIEFTVTEISDWTPRNVVENN